MQMNRGEAVFDGTHTVDMSDGIFQKLGSFVEETTGIKMPPSKKTMLEGRLRKRLRVLEIAGFKEYCDYVLSQKDGGAELVHMLDAVTTNKTDFFREPTHFDYLTRTVLPRLQQVHGSGGRLNLQAWSAGCSTGEEPYTLAMVLNEFALQQSGFSFSVSATDLSTRVLEKAISGVYDEEKIAPVPMPLRRKYLLRSKDRTRQTVRIVQELRSKISFGRLNFMDRNFTMKKMHFIFCRNVIIYFDRATQEKLLNKFCKHLVPGGYIFMGHSETLSGLNVPLVQVEPTVYVLQ